MKRLTVQQAFDLLEIDPMNYKDLLQGNCNNYDQAKEALDKFKQEVEKQRRRLAMKHHPDKGGDTEKMQEINNVADLLLKTGRQPIRPVIRQPIIIVRPCNYSTTVRYSNYTSTTTSWT